MRIKNQSKRRTSSQQAENKFSAYGEQVQKERRTSSKLAEMRIKENSLAQQKNSLGQEDIRIFASFLIIEDWFYFLPHPDELPLTKG